MLSRRIAYGQAEVQPGSDGVAELDAELRDDAEALLAHGDFVATRREGPDGIGAGFRGEHLPAESGIFVDDGDDGVDDGQSGRVKDLAHEFGVMLCLGWSRGDPAKEQQKHHPAWGHSL